MPIPEISNKDSPEQVIIRVSENVLVARRGLGISQEAFAKLCDIPFRTYKRFEAGKCDSLKVFVKIIKIFERITALNLLFPPLPVKTKPRDAVISLNILREKLKK